MCPLCLTSLAVTVATTTGVGTAAIAVATRVAKSLANRPGEEARHAVPSDTGGLGEDSSTLHGRACFSEKDMC